MRVLPECEGNVGKHVIQGLSASQLPLPFPLGTANYPSASEISTHPDIEEKALLPAVCVPEFAEGKNNEQIFTCINAEEHHKIRT